MIKAASKLLFFLVALALLAATVPLRAQSDSGDIDMAAKEAVRRQADTILLRQKLAEAQGAQQKQDLPTAAKLYENCYKLAQDIGTGVEPEAQATVNGLVTVLMELTRQEQQQQDYGSADENLKRVLVVDPNNQMAQLAKRENDRLLAAQAGNVPSPELVQKLTVASTNNIRIATMVQDGKLLLEAGKVDEAEAKLEEAYRENPDNVAAYHYLQLIRERRAAQATRKSDLDARTANLQVEEDWNTPQRTKRNVQMPNSFARTNLVYTSKGRQNILSKLDRIHIDSVKYDGLPLAEVINNLSELTRSRDPEKIGINFYMDRSNPSAAATGPGAVDPTTGLPVASLSADAVDVGSVTVKISPALSNVRLADVLDAITKTSDKPIKFVIEDYAIVFSLKAPEAVPMYTRVFHIDPNTFRQGLESVSGIPFGDITTSSGSGGGGGGGGGGSSQDTITSVPRVTIAPVSGGSGGGQSTVGGVGLRYVTRTNTYDGEQILVRQFFTAAGVDLDLRNPANIGKALFFNDRRGTLMVHSTEADLDIIAAALETLNQSPPQINIKAKFAEIQQNDSKALGFNWMLGNVSMGGGNVVGSGGTMPSLTGVPTAANPNGFFPGTSLANIISPAASDQNLTAGLRNLISPTGGNSIPTVATFTGILTDPQFQVAINALDNRDGVELLNAPEITTESGRQAQVQVAELETIVTGVQIQASSGSGSFSGVASGVNSPIVQQVPTANYTTEVLPFGPVMDVIPYVSADEYSVQMTLIPTVTEFVGYDSSVFAAGALVAGQGSTPADLTRALPLPHFRMRQITTSAIVWDSQTIVLGGLISDNETKIKDKVPLLGDMPLIGRLFQSESTTKSKSNLMIFVTPTIINPDGTRYHSDEEMPFAQNSIPPQKPINQ